MLPLLAQTETELEEVAGAVGRIGLREVLWSLGILVAAILVSRVAKRLVTRAVARGDTSRFAAELVGRFTAYVIVMAGFLYGLAVLDVPIAPLLGALGIVGLALAFAFQDIAENFIAGIMLLVRRPLRPGDQISTNEHRGTVEDVTLRTVVLRSFGGLTIYMPNAMVLKAPIINYTRRGMRRTTLEVGVAYDTDLDHAREVMLKAVEGVEGVLPEPAPEAYVREFGGSSVEVAVRFWHEPQVAAMWRTRDAVARALKRALDEAGITIPFPQRTVWFASEAAQPDGGEE